MEAIRSHVMLIREWGQQWKQKAKELETKLKGVS